MTLRTNKPTSPLMPESHLALWCASVVESIARILGLGFYGINQDTRASASLVETRR